MGLHRTFVALTFLLTASAACHGGLGRDDSAEGLEPSGPREVFRSDGGSLETWSSESRPLQDANVAADRLTLESRGLALLQYSDAAQLAYVLEGKAKIGLSYPWEQSTHIRTVRQGDVVAIPRGIGHWWYNSGDNRFVVINVADTVHAVNSGQHEAFYLNGGSSAKEGGSSVLHGFDEELLSQAWDVDRDVVRQIRDSQKGTMIVRVKEGLDISEDSESRESEEFWANYTYNLDEARPDIEVNDGGSFRLLTNKKLPILKEVHLSAIRVKLDREALYAPSYAWNADVLIYVTKGNGRIQITGSEEQLLDSDVREGSLVVVPQFHPDIIKASKNGLEFVAIATSDQPIFSFLAGKNAVYRNIPIEVAAAGNNVPVEVEQQIRDRRQHDAVIFPPRGKAGTPTKEAIVKLNNLFFLQFEELKAILDLKSQIQV